MRRHVVGLVSIAVGAVVVFLGACSSSNNSGSGTANTATDFENQYCGFMATCCGAESYPSDGKQCRTLLALEAPSGSYNAQAGNACIAAVQAASQKNPGWCVDSKAVTDTNKACDPVFGKNGGGSVQPGGTCQSTSDCAAAPAGDALDCRDYFGSSGATTRICQVWTHGKAGDACGGTEVDTASGSETSFVGSEDSDGGTFPSQIAICYAADGVTCSSSGTSGGYTCTALGQVGDSCSSTGSSGCVPAAYCDFTSGKCLARIADGQACSDQQTCVDGDYCDTAGSGKCAAQVASGQACTTSQQCQTDDCTNGKCGAGLGGLTLGLFCGSPSDGG